MAKRLNTQRNVEVDFALIEEADHMYNNHLVDLYKIVGNYVIEACKKKAPQKKRRGRRKKSEIENSTDEPLLLTDEAADEGMDADFDDDFDEGDDE